MPSDFGDESGEKFCDWLLQIGQEAGHDAMQGAAARLSIALKKTKGDTPTEYIEQVEWARLNMVELESIEGYDSIKQILAKSLYEAGIDHSFFKDDKTGHESLLFRVEDATKVDRVFDELIENVDRSLEKAATQLEQTLEKAKEKDKEVEQDRDEEPLEKRASRVRASAKALENDKGRSHERESAREDKFQEVKTK